MSTDARPDYGGAVHTWFGLSYANYSVLPRTLLQSMPAEWQERLAGLMDEMEAAFRHVGQPDAYEVKAAELAEVGSLGDARLKALGITRHETECTVDHDHAANFTLDCDAEVYFSDAERDDMTADFMVAIPVADPVPHYDRGRAYVEPNLDAMREANGR